MTHIKKVDIYANNRFSAKDLAVYMEFHAAHQKHNQQMYGNDIPGGLEFVGTCIVERDDIDNRVDNVKNVQKNAVRAEENQMKNEITASIKKGYDLSCMAMCVIINDEDIESDKEYTIIEGVTRNSSMDACNFTNRIANVYRWVDKSKPYTDFSVMMNEPTSDSIKGYSTLADRHTYIVGQLESYKIKQNTRASRANIIKTIRKIIEDARMNLTRAVTDSLIKLVLSDLKRTPYSSYDKKQTQALILKTYGTSSEGSVYPVGNFPDKFKAELNLLNEEIRLFGKTLDTPLHAVCHSSSLDVHNPEKSQKEQYQNAIVRHNNWKLLAENYYRLKSTRIVQQVENMEHPVDTIVEIVKS